MPAKKGTFTIGDIVPKYQKSREMTPNPQTVLVGAETMTVRCDTCEHTWVAGEHGKGHYSAALGGDMLLRCPECDAHGSANIKGKLAAFA